jgi:hypothetical protein
MMYPFRMQYIKLEKEHTESRPASPHVSIEKCGDAHIVFPSPEALQIK